MAEGWRASDSQRRVRPGVRTAGDGCDVTPAMKLSDKLLGRVPNQVCPTGEGASVGLALGSLSARWLARKKTPFSHNILT